MFEIHGDEILNFCVQCLIEKIKKEKLERKE